MPADFLLTPSVSALAARVVADSPTVAPDPAELPAGFPVPMLREVLAGLRAPRKSLPSKYFYDAAGDAIFQQIMRCPEYYPTRAELLILETRAPEIAALLASDGAPPFDVVELGAGDATKSVYLLRAILARDAALTYRPIDISGSIIASLEARLPGAVPGAVPGLRVAGLHGEYLPMLAASAAATPPGRARVVLFMGANIGNMSPAEALEFCQTLRAQLSPADRLLIGFDLIKSPHRILAAYNDAGGLTRAFNLNLLTRLNRELGADFDVAAFSHFPTYDPATGACSSYLVSARAQTVYLAGQWPIAFAAGEVIHTEISQKYTLAQTDDLARAAGFRPIRHFLDPAADFLLALWE